MLRSYKNEIDAAKAWDGKARELGQSVHPPEPKHKLDTLYLSCTLMLCLSHDLMDVQTPQVVQLSIFQTRKTREENNKYERGQHGHARTRENEDDEGVTTPMFQCQ